MSEMELGELKQEVIHAVQKPYVRLHGLDRYHNPAPWKASMKKGVKENTQRLQSSVVYEITNEILEYLEPSVVKGNQHQLYKAMLNGKPRHYNQWIEFDLGHLYEGEGLQAFHVYSTQFVGRVENRRVGTQWDAALVGHRKDVGFGDVYLINHYYETFQKKKVGFHPYSSKTCVWSLSGRYIDESSTGMTEEEKRERENATLALWLLGDNYRKFSNDMQPLIDRWSGGLNDLIMDLPENKVRELVADKININRYARLIAILSLMNYEWFVEEPKDLGIQGQKFKQEVVPGDAHHRIVLKLPKTKGRVIVPKMPRRSEPYGVKRHEVSGHERKYRDSHGNVYKTIYIKPHWRGDERLGTITKDYVVERDDKKDD